MQAHRLVLCGLLALLGCKTDAGPDDGRLQCDDGEVNIDDACVRLCNSNRDCPDSSPCIGGRCAAAVLEPAITGVTPASPANDNAPFIHGNVDSNLTVRLYDDVGCTNVRGIGSSEAFRGAGIQVAVSDDTTTTFWVRAELSDGALSRCSESSLVYVEDSTPPVVPVINAVSPPSPANDNAPHALGSADAESTVQIFADAACTAPWLAVGSAADFADDGIVVPVADNTVTQLYARALDAVGNASACSSAPATYVEDSQAPSFTGAASAHYDGVGASIVWSPANDNTAAGNAVVYEICRSVIYGGCSVFTAYGEVTGTTSFADHVVTPGATYYYRVRARDPSGNVSGNGRDVAAFIGCGTGYIETGAGCEWQHGVVSWDLDSTTGWTVTGAVFDTNSDDTDCSLGDEGSIAVDYQATCVAPPTISQVVTVPPLEQSEPFQLVAQYTYDPSEPCSRHCNALDPTACAEEYNACIWTSGGCRTTCEQWTSSEDCVDSRCRWTGAACVFDDEASYCGYAQLQVSFGGRTATVDSYQADSCQGSMFCLGDKAYGGSRTLTVRPLRTNYACEANSGYEIHPTRLESVSIEPSSYCARPGEVMLGDGESTIWGWAWPSDKSTFEWGPTLGEQGTGGAHVRLATRCASASSSTYSYSVPSSLPTPAIELWSKSDENARLGISVGFNTLFPVAASSDGRKSRICLPRLVSGTAEQWYISVSSPGALPGGQCSDPMTADAYFDNIKLVSDARCTANADVFDGGFEVSAVTPTFLGWQSSTSYNSGERTLTSELRADHVGRGGSAAAGHIQIDACGSTRISTLGSVPAPISGASPALRFFYKLNNDGTVGASAGFGNAGATLGSANDWSEQKVCVEPVQASTIQPIVFSAYRYGSCDNGPVDLWIDDVEVVNDPSCAP